MRSNRSDSPASPNRWRLPVNWPIDIVLPILLGLLLAAVISPYSAMFLGPDFGLSRGHDAPWPWAFAALFAIAYWVTAAVDRSALPQTAKAIVLIVLGILAVVGWCAVDPAYGIRSLLRDPVSLVRDHSYLLPAMIVGLGVWVQAIRSSLDPSYTAPEYVRSTVRSSWLALALGMVLAALVKGDMGSDGVRQSLISLPIALASSAGAIALAEFRRTRDLAVRRGGQAPGWDRWMRIFGGTVVAVLVVMGIGLLVVSPGTLQSVVDGVSAVFRTVGMAVLYVVYGIVYAVIYVFRGVAWLLGFLGLNFKPPEPPTLPDNERPEGTPVAQEPQQPGGEMPYLTLIRWIGIILGLIAAVVIIAMMTRKSFKDTQEGEFEEERTSLFSGDLLRSQFRDLFRRTHKPPARQKADLDSEPESVREAMLYVQVLARRQGVGRAPDETPADFAQRLAQLWPETDASLEELRVLYEGTRYGETEQDRQRAVVAWRDIWARRRDTPGESDR